MLRCARKANEKKENLSARLRRLAIKIQEDANFLAEQEVKMARQKLREEMADQAEATARQLIERNLSGADQNRLVDDFIRTIGQSR